MRTTWLAVILLLVTSLIASGQDSPFPKAAPASQGIADKDLETLANAVRGFVGREQVVGAELLIIKNNHVVFHQGFGHKEKDKNQALPPNTIFCVRSMTKPVIGAAVQILIDEGKVGLEDPVSKHLPAFDNDQSRAITVRQLLTHKGGLKLSTLLSVGLKGVSGVAELADLIGKNGPDLKPGEKFNYSDDGTDTLTALVAKVTQMPAEHFVQERILDPLGMKDTICVLQTDDPRLQRVTAAYGGATGTWNKFWTPGEPPIFSYFLGSQGMYSTPADYAHFLKLIADGGKWNGKQILSKEAIERILTPTDASSLTTTFDDRTCVYGQMMMLYRDNTGKVRTFGHGGSDGTHAYAIPEKDLYVLYFTQSHGNLTSLDFEPAVHRLLVEPGKKQFVAEKDVDPKEVAPLLGLYWFDAVKCPVAVEVREGKLQLEIPFQAEVELKPTENPNEWVARLNPNLKIAFKRDGTEPATGLEIKQAVANHALQRIIPEQDLPKVDELLALRERTQGTAKLKDLGVVHLSGTVEHQPSKRKGTSESYEDGGKRHRSMTKLGDAATTQVFDGDKGWIRQTTLADQVLDAAALENARLNSSVFPAMDWKPLFKSMAVVKRFEANNRKFLVLRCVPKVSSPRTLVIDAETGTLVADLHVEVVPGVGRIGSRIEYDDFKDVKGVQLPSKIVQTFPTPLLGRLEVVLDKFETNVTPPPETFALK